MGIWLRMGLLGGAVALLAVSACDGDTAVTPQSCVAGQSQACTGPNGCSGFQECAADGSAFGACVCGEGGGGTGGTGTGNTGAGATGAGGTGTGGTGAGGTGAGGGTGGSGASSPDCPVDQPDDDGDCTDDPVGSWCIYGDDQCICLQDAWQCATCPADEPTDGDSCQSSGGMPDRCAYGDSQCICRQGEWSCATCPQDEPTDGDDCDPGLLCTYGDTFCGCQQAQWHCETP